MQIRCKSINDIHSGEKIAREHVLSVSLVSLFVYCQRESYLKVKQVKK